MIKLIIVSIFLTLEAPPVKVEILPSVLVAGDAMRITCRVPRHEKNRWIEYGIEGLSSSYRQLDPDSQTIFRVLVEHVPCETDLAYCTLGREAERPIRSTARFTVACGQP